MISNTAGLILAGGLGSRMNHQDKGMVLFKQKPLVEYPLALLRKNVDCIVISANRNLDKYASYGHPVIPDLPQYTALGPLGGIYSASMQLPENITFIQVVPCDTPFLPDHLVEQLHTALLQTNTDIAMAISGSNQHPSIIQFRRSLLPDLKRRLDQHVDKLRLRSFVLDNAHTLVNFEQEDFFINFNNPELLKLWDSLQGST
ncbi:molybdenum cofactor guanylyltransferase MobA [Advenella alkanexedens]|uniref:molybdenum cofactor guanylyltransferase MobA n=1 Tax=Advenella alkanexedens TaxID=1481665 RepID=UPI0026768BA8|nr:molybdenum cofactor guanylyltransferase MobA [Advenella alkanexedens]WKU20734.1 molybdenum cofactor guanylyltransferase MobA [Advenella alkanexedens]